MSEIVWGVAPELEEFDRGLREPRAQTRAFPLFARQEVYEDMLARRAYEARGYARTVGDPECVVDYKLRYPTRGDAFFALVEMETFYGAEFDRRLQAYECPSGGHWHLGRPRTPTDRGVSIDEARAELGAES